MYPLNLSSRQAIGLGCAFAGEAAITFMLYNNIYRKITLPPDVKNTIDKAGQTSPFVLDDNVDKAAQKQFNENRDRNCVYHACSVLVGIVSVIGFGASLVALFKSRHLAVILAVNSVGLSKIYFDTIDPETYFSRAALDAKDEDTAINYLAKGAASNQAFMFLDANVDRSKHIKFGDRTLTEWFVEKGMTKVVAYILMLEPDVLKRAKTAMEVLGFCKDIKTAQLLIDLGADPKKCSEALFYYSVREKWDLLDFFVKKGGTLDAGTFNYQQRDEKQKPTTESDDFSFTISFSDSITPLEKFLQAEVDERTTVECLGPVFKALSIDPSVLMQKSANDLYHALNKAGVRIRWKWALRLFGILKKQ